MQPLFGSNFLAVLIAGVMMAATLGAGAQSRPTRAPAVPSLNVALTYDPTLSGVITSSHFWMQGASVQIEGRFYGGWGTVADISDMHVGNMNSTGVGLDIVTATFGPRYTWSPRRARYEFFGEGLLGIADGFNSVFPGPLGAQTEVNSLALKTGGGMNLRLNSHYALRLFQADYLRTQFPNSTNNTQNNLQFATGVVLRFR